MKKIVFQPNQILSISVLLLVERLNDNFEELVQKCLKRDNDARKRVYDLFSAQMFSICSRYTKNKSQAEDIFQDAFLKVFENIGQLKDPAALPGWIKMIFVRTAISSIQAEVKFDTTDLTIVEKREFFDHDIVSEISLKEITALIQELPTKSRMVFNLYVIEGYSHQEIAELMGISVGTSKSQLFDAKQLLKKQLIKINKPLLKVVV